MKILCLKQLKGEYVYKTQEINVHDQQDTAMYHCNTSILMINKDDYLSTNICLMALSELFPKCKMAEKTPEHPGREQNS